MDYSWLDMHSNKYAQSLGGRISIGVSRNTESIVRTSGTEAGMVITLVVCGKGRIRWDTQEMAIDDSMILFRHPGSDYSLTLTSGVMHRRCFLMLPDEIYRLLCLVHPSMSKVPMAFHVDDVRRFFDDFLLVYDHIRSGHDEDLFALLPVLERYILRLLSGYVLDGKENALRRARGQLEVDYRSSLEEIAAHHDMSYNTFRKYFHEAYGISPQQYRLHSRVEKAKQLLSMGHQCSEVAAMLDYPDLFSFSHQFKQISGTSPSEYRKAHIL